MCVCIVKNSRQKEEDVQGPGRKRETADGRRRRWGREERKGEEKYFKS